MGKCTSKEYELKKDKGRIFFKPKKYKIQLRIYCKIRSKQSIADLFNNPDDEKLSDIRRSINRLRDILPKKYRKKIKKKLYEIEHKENLSEAEKEKNDEYFRKLVRILNNKEKYGLYDRDDFDYYGIRDRKFI